MKNIIAITSLFAAGTLLANAATDYWWSSTESASFGKNSLWLDSDSVAVGDMASVDAQLILGGKSGLLVVDQAYDVNALIFSSSPTSTLYKFSFTTANSTISANLINKWSNSNIEISLSAEAEGALKSTGEFVLFSSEAAFAGNNKIDGMTRTWPGDNTAGNWFSVFVNGNGNNVLDTALYSTVDAAREALALQSTRKYALVATSNKLSLVSSIPEPSAFGLLAGLGALALAGTRRRRRK